MRYGAQAQQVFELMRNNPNAQAQMRAPIFEEKVVDLILSRAKVTDKQVTKDELLAEDDLPEGYSEAKEAAKPAKAKAAKKAEAAAEPEAASAAEAEPAPTKKKPAKAAKAEAVPAEAEAAPAKPKRAAKAKPE
jgi:trigger factor